MTSILSDGIEPQDAILPVADIKVGVRYRKLDEKHVEDLIDSYERMGGQLQIQPIVVDQDKMLVDGAHRLEAAKRSGWTQIRAVILTGVADRDREILEIEANAVRRQFSPAELEHAWTKYYEPTVKRLTQAKQEHRNLTEEVDDVGLQQNAVTGRGEAISVNQMIPQITGKSEQYIQQVREIRETAENVNMPVPLREAAKKGIQKLSAPGTPVAPVYNSLVALKNRLEQQQKSQQELREEHLFARMNALVQTTTGLASKLNDSLLDDIQAAAKDRSVNFDDLRASRNALTVALAKLMAVEASVAENKGPALYQLSQEIAHKVTEVATKTMEERLEDE